jgi:FixJ family two-component response regulator
MLDATPIVFIVDDDSSIRDSLMSLIRSAGLQSEAFGSTREFLARPRPAAPCCLVLDVRLPNLNGLELHARIASDRHEMPVIFLPKSFDGAELLNAVGTAIERSRATLAHEARLRALRELHSSLTRREIEVLALVVAGRLNKQVGGQLGISELTVKAHRGQVMRKMQARSFAHLLDMARGLGYHPAIP